MGDTQDTSASGSKVSTFNLHNPMKVNSKYFGSHQTSNRRNLMASKSQNYSEQINLTEPASHLANKFISVQLDRPESDKSFNPQFRSNTIPVQPQSDFDDPFPEEDDFEPESKSTLKPIETQNDLKEDQMEGYLENLHLQIVQKMKEIWLKETQLSESSFFKTLLMKLPEGRKPSFKEVAGFVTAKIFYEKAAEIVLSGQN